MARTSAGAAPPGPGDVLEVLLSATRAFVGIAARSVAGLAVDVTLAQVRTLMLLAASGPQRAIDVATELSVNPSTGTRMCDRLVRKGLVRRTRRAGDRRVVQLTLTAAGRALVAEVSRRRRAELTRLVEAIPPGRHIELLETLGAITAAAGETGADLWMGWPHDDGGDAGQGAHRG